ncbi:EF-P 5-aminopentanol modification-associated protein YfmF [Companilactobacillus mishanensis]|uniref:Insulinase family protein n=1 Tax=Companilactobacillus mishanensis TaxID=2486008 RepID=A0ABW9P908_9LACO|nr:insulinase family protein [Companilactobacillus mishanensis]MQS45638.1 insulinase family protein [Companilactobacillus mishanensis]
MKEILAKNVVLNVNQLDKFRTIKIQIDFLRPLSKDESTKRRLLANVLSNSSKKYPSFKSLNDREMELYGAEINAYTRSLLNFNDLGFSVEFADPKFLIGDKSQIQDNIEVLSEIIFNPNLKNTNEFDDTAFTIEKRNMMSNLDAVGDNKDLVSVLELFKLVNHNNPNKQIPIFGDATQLDSLENSALYEYYKDVIKNDMILINVVGDVDPTEISKLIRDSLLGQSLKSERTDIKIQLPNFDDLVKSPAEKLDHESINQSRLSIAYVTEKLDKGFSHLAPQAMNLIFGGDDQSQLFLQVRERNSLAYSVSSSYQATDHLLTVQSGLDAKDIDQAIDLIQKQIDFMKNGKFTDSQIEHAKKVLFTRREIGSDSIQHYIMRSIWETIYPKTLLDDKSFRAELNKLDRNNIQSVAEHMHRIAQYELIGD